MQDNSLKDSSNKPLEKSIKDKIQRAFNGDFFDIVNESHKHNVPKNAETHFKVTLVSVAFEQKNKVKRHQQLYALLADELNNGVHALALHLYSPQEWEKKKSSPESPDCLGGGDR